MTARTYSGNVLTQRNAVTFQNGLNAAESHTILIRLAPDTVTLDVPFNKVTTWDRLMHTIYEIYTRNNSRACNVTVNDARECIIIKNDLTGGLIIPEHWLDFIKPHVKISAHFLPPLHSPPWHPLISGQAKVDDEDTEMLDGIVTYALENSKISGLLEYATNWKSTENRFLVPPPLICKQEEVASVYLPTPLSTTPSPSFGFANGTNAVTPMENGKTYLRPRTNGTSALVGVLTDSLVEPRSMTQSPITEGMSFESISPPVIPFRDPFTSLSLPRINNAAGPPAKTQRASSPINLPSALSPTRHTPVSPGTSRSPPSRSTSSKSRDYSNLHSTDINPRGKKRNCNEITKKSSDEGLRAMSESPLSSSESNGYSRAASMETEASNGHARRLATPTSRTKVDPNAGKTVVLHQKVLLLDSISAGETIKIIRTKEGDLIAVRDDEEVETVIERRLSTASFISASQFNKKEKEPETTRAAKKRAYNEASAEELVRIWSGHGSEPPVKKTKTSAFDKLTTDHKRKIARFVQDQNIIRVDHWSAPIIHDWKASAIPDADEKQTEDYIVEITSNIFSDPAKRNKAFKLFMENHNFAHKTPTSSSKSNA